MDEDEEMEIEEEDSDEESDEPQSLKDKITALLNKFTKPKKKNNEEIGSEDATSADVKPKPNKTKQLIQAALVVGIIALIADEVMKDETADQPAPQVATSDQADGGAPEDSPETTTDEPTSDSTVSESDMGLNEATIDEPTQTPDLTVTDSAPTESDSTSSTDFSTTDSSPDTDFSTTDSAPSTDFSTTDSSVSDFPSQESPSTDFSESTTTTTPSEDFSSSESQGSPLSDSVSDLSSPMDDDANGGDLTEKILQDLENQTKSRVSETPTQYVAPPDYEYSGRGLVYNCKALHWACIDGPSYKTCEDNFNYQKSQNAKPECYPFNVYENSRGCANMQNRMVSSGAKTEFCNGN